MRGATIITFLSILAGLLIAMEPGGAKAGKPSPEKPTAEKHVVYDVELRNYAAERAKHVLVTKEPHQVIDPILTLCVAPTSPDVLNQRMKRGDNPHENYAIQVYVTENGRAMMESGRGIYPVGTVILKEKQLIQVKAANSNDAAPAVVQPQLFTGMLKREAGYNPECGDWEFFVVDGAATKLQARGKIDSCSACHQEYKQTDFVTRAYMPKK